MKYIEKREEPLNFIKWKKKRKVREDWCPEWKRLKKDVKDELMEALLVEQGGICCYCCRDISATKRHIEHFKPQNNCKDRYDYQNILACCQADKMPGEPWHCGYTKGDWFENDVIISPLDKNCETYFRYTAAGCIYPQDDTCLPSLSTIEILNLNDDQLKSMRREAIDGALGDIQDLSSEEIDSLIQGYQSRDINGHFTPFCMAIVHILRYFLHG